MPGFERAALLRRVSALHVKRADMIAEIMSRESGKSLVDARGEVIRPQDTINLSAEEAIRIEGEHIPLDSSAMGAGKIAVMLRFPVGVIAGITPLNAPFNLAIRAVRTIRTGGVIINGSSTWRTDQLAYGGVKDSGIGREGPRYAMRDMTEDRLMLFNL